MRWYRGVPVALILLAACAVFAAPLKVVCRMGQPPFNDAESVTAGKCVGLFADAFYMAMNQTGLAYTLDIMNVNSVDSLVSLDKVTGQSKYDIALTYQTETAARQAIYDFSVALEQSADCIALRPAYRKAVGTLTGAVIRDSVLYVFLIWCLLALFMALVILLFEWLNPQSEMQSMPLWVRPLHAIEMGFEVVGTFGTSEDMESQVTRSLRSVIAIMGFFIVTVFASAVTSQLTSTSLSSQTVTVRDVRGVNIAIASSTLLGYLNGFGVGANATLVNNLNQFAQEFYTGGQAGYDGFSTACDIVSYLHDIHGANKLGFIISEPYFKSGNGAYDLRSLPFSKALNKTVRNLIDTALSDIRESGSLATLISTWVPAAPPKASTDLPVDDTTFTVIKAVVGVSYGGMMVIVAALFVYHFVVAKRTEEEREPVPNHHNPNEKYAMVWKHKKFKEIDDESRAMIQHILAAHSRTNAPVEMVVVKPFEPTDH